MITSQAANFFVDASKSDFSSLSTRVITYGTYLITASEHSRAWYKDCFHTSQDQEQNIRATSSKRSIMALLPCETRSQLLGSTVQNPITAKQAQVPRYLARWVSTTLMG